jgi:MraZ protein
VAFRGEHYHTVDDKGRVIIPLKFRNDLGNTFVITRGLGETTVTVDEADSETGEIKPKSIVYRPLFIYREKDFQALEERLLNQPSMDKHALIMKRWLLSAASEASADTQGRVAILSNLRDFANIKEEVVIAGTGEKIEIWSREGWDALNASLTDDDIMLSAVETGLGKTL